MITETMLSGFSSGGMMTTNMLRLEPELYGGAAIISSTLLQSLTDPFLDSDEVADKFQDKPLYFHLGAGDAAVKPWMTQNGIDFFEPSGANIKFDLIRDFEHVVPNNLPEEKTYNKYKTCASAYLHEVPDSTPEKPNFNTMNNCGYNLAWYMFNHLTSAKKHPVELKEREIDHTKKGNYYAFDQTKFSTPEAHMADQGYLYIPDACADGEYCTLHVHFHGCQQGGPYYMDTTPRGTGFIEYAATNNIILLFPQNDDEFVFPGAEEPMQYCWGSVLTDDKFNP